MAMWLVFSDVWNAIVEELRAIDLISNTERDNLVFVHLDIDSSIEVRRRGCPRSKVQTNKERSTAYRHARGRPRKTAACCC